MMLKQKVLLIILHFFVSWITEFSNFAELQWLGNFSLLEINYISGLLNFVWIPFIPMAISKFVDWLSTRVGFGYQAGFVLAIFTLIWFKIALISVDETQKFTTLLLIAVAELGPTTLHILLDASRVQHLNRWDDNVLAICEQSKIIGSAVATLMGGFVVHHTDVQYTFILHAVFFGTTSLLAFLLGYYQHTDHPTYAQVAIDDGTDEKRVHWNPDLVEEYVIPAREGERKKRWHIHPDTAIRTFAYFMLIMNMLPSGGGDCLFYFTTGPLGINLWEMGIISAFSAVVEVIAVFLYNRLPKMGLRASAFMTASFNSIGQFALLVVVSRVLAERVTTFNSIFVIYSALSFARGFTGMTYNTVLQETCETGKEAQGMTTMKTFPRFGIVVKWLLDISMTKYYHVNHDDYSQFVSLMTVTSLLWSIGVWSTLLVTNK